MDQKVRQRLKWVQMCEATGHAGKTCLRCGISRPTLRKWYHRFKKDGIAGLEEHSKRPHKLSGKKVTKEHEKLILDLRSGQNLGARRIQSELIWRNDLRLSLATIHKILKKHEAPALVRIKRKIGQKRYDRPIPGDRVQMDTMKVKPGLYQYTAVDDCSRYIVAAVYKRRTAENTLHFLEKVCEETSFPIQRIQTDRGTEFFAHKVQKLMMDWGIKFRPVKPRSPHLNGKVERAQKTILAEFYPSVDLDDPDLQDRLDEWVFHYNWMRGHGSLSGKAPIDRICERREETPLSEEVYDTYDPSKEWIRDQNYSYDLRIMKVKGSL